MPPLKHQKQERFCLEYFKSGNAAASAVLAGYSVRSIRAIASTLLTKINIQKRLEELRKKAEADSIMTVVERKQRLSEIARAKVPDFVDEDGIKVDKVSRNVGAVAEVTTRTKLYRKTGEAVNITNFKLHSPIQAINELNKMEGIYSEKIDINIHLVPAINNLVIQFIQIAREVNNIPDPDERLRGLALGIKAQLEKQFPDIPKEDHDTD